MTIKQLLEATQDNPDDSFKVDGSELFQVRLIGNILSVSEATTNITYSINDGTGQMDVKFWLDDNSATKQRSAECVEGVWVSVEGNVREYEGRKHILCFNIRPIQDPNEIPHHFLQSILIHCERTRGSLASKQNTVQMSGQGVGQPSLGIQSQGGNFGMSSSSSSSSSTNPLADRIHKIFQQEGMYSDEGLHVQYVFEKVKNEGITFQQVKQAVDFLGGEGLVYTTIDENHFKSTESFY